MTTVPENGGQAATTQPRKMASNQWSVLYFGGTPFFVNFQIVYASIAVPCAIPIRCIHSLLEFVVAIALTQGPVAFWLLDRPEKWWLE